MAPRDQACVCSQCYKDVTENEDSLTCTGICERKYHPKCLNIKANKLKTIKKAKTSWCCYNCEMSKEGGGNNDEPLQLILARLDKLDEFVLQLRNVEKTIKELEKSREFDSKLLDLMKEENKELKHQITNVVSQQLEMAALISKVKSDQHVEKSKQQQLETRDEIVIQNLPIKVSNTENEVKNLVLKAAAVISPDISIIEENDIKSIKVIPLKSNKPPIVIVKLVHSDLCDRLLKIKKAEMPQLLVESLLEEAEEGKSHGIVYINQNHSKPTRDLFFEARKKLKQRDGGHPPFKFVWISPSGKVFTRKSITDQAVHIKTSGDIVALIQPYPQL